MIYRLGGRSNIPAHPVREIPYARVSPAARRPYDGDSLEITASSDAVILYGHARPLNEPVVAHGPFVMNTREEIVQAIADYQAGKFGEVLA